MAASDRPTAKQLRYLRALAERTGTTFATPTTRCQASEAIDELTRRPAEARSTRRRCRGRELDASCRPYELAGGDASRELIVVENFFEELIEKVESR